MERIKLTERQLIPLKEFLKATGNQIQEMILLKFSVTSLEDLNASDYEQIRIFAANFFTNNDFTERGKSLTMREKLPIISILHPDDHEYNEFIKELVKS